MEKLVLDARELAYEMESSFEELLEANVERKNNEIYLTFHNGMKFKVIFQQM